MVPEWLERLHAEHPDLFDGLREAIDRQRGGSFVIHLDGRGEPSTFDLVESRRLRKNQPSRLPYQGAVTAPTA